MKESRAWKVRRKKAQELIGNGADVEKSVETWAQAQSSSIPPSFPSLPSHPGAAGSRRHRQKLVKLDQTLLLVLAANGGNPPPTHPHTLMHAWQTYTGKWGREGCYIWANLSKPMHILRHHPVLSPQCGPQHYITVFVCAGQAACVRVIHCFTSHTRDGSQW